MSKYMLVASAVDTGTSTIGFAVYEYAGDGSPGVIVSKVMKSQRAAEIVLRDKVVA